MRKAVTWLSSATLVLGLMALTGCRFTDAQMKAVAQQTGLFSAVGWIAADNPTDEQIASIKGLLTLIEDNANAVQDGMTYTEVLYPVMDEEIVNTMEPHHRPMARAASLALLGSIDMMFAVNPSWREDADRAFDVVKAFIAGARQGFGLGDDHPAMIQARQTGALRMQVIQESL